MIIKLRKDKAYYICENCRKPFLTDSECRKHEEECGEDKSEVNIQTE